VKIANFIAVGHKFSIYGMQTGVKLVQIALVYDEHRLHFSLTAGTDEKTQSLPGNGQLLPGNTQLLPGNQAVLHSSTTQMVYQVKLQFTGGLFGHFSQMIVFDFGRRPLLSRKVVVELGDQKIRERVQVLRDRLTFNR